MKLSQLKKLTDDLVKLEEIKDPFIVHNLRERCKNDDIYVCDVFFLKIPSFAT